MAPQTAGALLTAALVIGVSLVAPARLVTAITGLGGMFLVALALTSLTGYATSLSDTAGWLGFTRMSPQTAIGTLLTAAGLVTYGWAHRDPAHYWMPAFVPIIVTAIIWLVGGLLYTSTRDREHRIAVEAARAGLEVLARTLSAELSADGHAIQRMVQRWSLSPGAQPAWEADATLYINQLFTLERLELTAPCTVEPWIAAAAGSHADYAAERERLLEDAPANLTPRSITIGRGDDAVIVTSWPLGTRREEGHLVSVMRPSRLVSRAVIPSAAVTPSVGPGLFSQVDELDTVDLAIVGLPLDVTWRVSATTWQPAESWLPLIVLLSFGAMGPIFGATIWQFRRAAIAEQASTEGKSRIETLLRRLIDVEMRSRLVLETTKIGVWDLNVQTGAVDVDDTFRAILGRVALVNPILDSSWSVSIHADDEARVRASLTAHLASQSDAPYEAEYRAKTAAGTWVWVWSRGRVVERTADGLPVRMLGTLHNIDERKRGEQTLRDTLEQKEVLLREVHHRVKNNLATVSSLLYLQAAQADAAAARLLDISRQRVQSMAMVHDILYQSDDLAAVQMQKYLSRLATHLRESFSSEPAIAIALEVEDLALTIDQAIPCGLVVNELVTNAAKHAFSDVARPSITIACRSVNRRCVLSVRDNGGGLAESTTRDSGMGLNLVRAMARQLEGECTFTGASPGFRATLEFAIVSPRIIA